MFKHTLIKTAVMTAALALSPLALRAEDQPSRSADRQSTPAGGDSATVGSRTDRAGTGRINRAPFNEQKFVEKAKEGNQFEIQLAQLAEQKAESQEVKQLAQAIQRDHQEANQALSQAGSGAQAQPGAANANPSSAAGAQQLGPVSQAKLAEFQKIEGAEFDQAYLYSQVAEHVKAVLWYRDAAAQAQSPQIKQYASQTLSRLQSHLQQAQQLAGWDEASTASATIHGDRSGHRDADRQSPGDTSSSNRQDVKGALGGTNGNATDRNAASGGAQPKDRSAEQPNR